MADDSTTTIRATFRTREAADLAVEHLVQQHGISRPDIFIQSATDRNTAGSEPSGGDASHAAAPRKETARIFPSVTASPSSSATIAPSRKT